MAGTFSQMHIQVVFAVRNREYLIREARREEVEKIMCGMVKYHGCKPLAIYCNPDHVHILIGIKPIIRTSDLVRDIKSASSRLINDNNWFNKPFHWQEGYGSFTYSNWDVQRIINYILNQPEHHKKQSFKEEYIAMLEEHDVSYEEKYVF